MEKASGEGDDRSPPSRPTDRSLICRPPPVVPSPLAPGPSVSTNSSPACQIAKRNSPKLLTFPSSPRTVRKEALYQNGYAGRRRSRLPLGEDAQKESPRQPSKRLNLLNTFGEYARIQRRGARAKRQPASADHRPAGISPRRKLASSTHG